MPATKLERAEQLCEATLGTSSSNNF